MGELSPGHWAIVIGVAVLLFGAKRLPDAARSLGQATRIMRAELSARPAEPAPAAPTAAAAPGADTPVAAAPVVPAPVPGATG